MSEEQSTSSQDAPFVAEFKDGRLEIVEIHYDKTDEPKEELNYEGGSEGYQYMEVVDSMGKNEVLDLLNMTLIKCYNGDGESYRLVSSNTECDDSETVTCILSNEDDAQEEQYMVVEDNKSVEYLQTDFAEETEDTEKTEPANQQPSPQWILEKAKALQKSKALMASLQRRECKGRRRKGELPPPHELLQSPTFKLYLYSCKICTFKCNAIKDLQAHKAAEHSGVQSFRGGRVNNIALQCPRCPYRGHTHAQLSKHMHEAHAKKKKETEQEISYSEAIDLDSAEVNAADVLVCGACGFESSSKDVFRRHIEEEHGAVAC